MSGKRQRVSGKVVNWGDRGEVLAAVAQDGRALHNVNASGRWCWRSAAASCCMHMLPLPVHLLLLLLLPLPLHLSSQFVGGLNLPPCSWPP